MRPELMKYMNPYQQGMMTGQYSPMHAMMQNRQTQHFTPGQYPTPYQQPQGGEKKKDQGIQPGLDSIKKMFGSGGPAVKGAQMGAGQITPDLPFSGSGLEMLISKPGAAMGFAPTAGVGAAGVAGAGAAKGALAMKMLPALAAMSDRRLKTNIRKIGNLPNGLNVYSYNYTWGEPSVGVMADEVKEVMPHAVFNVGGYDAVNYGEIL